MSVENYSYFIAAGRSLEQVETWHASATKCLEESRAWAKEVGAAELSFDARDGFHAMKFSDKAPPGWTKHPRFREWHIPSRARSKQAKAVYQRAQGLRPLKTPGESHLGPGEDGRTYFHYPSVRLLGGKWVIGQHEGCKTVPPDAIPIKRSEYMAMVEAHEEAKSPAAPASIPSAGAPQGGGVRP